MSTEEDDDALEAQLERLAKAFTEAHGGVPPTLHDIHQCPEWSAVYNTKRQSSATLPCSRRAGASRILCDGGDSAHTRQGTASTGSAANTTSSPQARSPREAEARGAHRPREEKPKAAYEAHDEPVLVTIRGGRGGPRLGIRLLGSNTSALIGCWVRERSVSVAACRQRRFRFDQRPLQLLRR